MSGPTAQLSIHIYCKIVDNHGDIGVCWRLARQLVHEHHHHVKLWVDDWSAARTVVHDLSQQPAQMTLNGVVFDSWRNTSINQDCTGDVLIEAFSCTPPEACLRQLAQRESKPIHINLEYFSAEAWVDGFHGLSGWDSFTRTRRWAYFQSTRAGGGGVLRERGLIATRRAWQAQNLITKPNGLDIALFAYSHAPYDKFLRALERLPSIKLTVCGAQSQAAVREFASTVNMYLPDFVAQPEFDPLLWQQDVLFVRGEDSLMRALWSGRPFVWHIYPQTENAHHAKLNAWLEQYTSDFPYQLKRSVIDLHHTWNGLISPKTPQVALHRALAQLSAWREQAELACNTFAKQKDLAQGLMDFVSIKILSP